jgi:hypothetical protein
MSPNMPGVGATEVVWTDCVERGAFATGAGRSYDSTAPIGAPVNEKPGVAPVVGVAVAEVEDIIPWGVSVSREYKPLVAPSPPPPPVFSYIPVGGSSGLNGLSEEGGVPFGCGAGMAFAPLYRSNCPTGMFVFLPAISAIS